MIKKNANDKPVSAKYHIVVLGNIDTNNWNKSNFFAPVMSQLEFRLMIALVVQMQVKSKQGDFTQESCQLRTIYVQTTI